MDKVAELIKAGKVREISDMRDETDLGGLKLTIDLKRGVDPDKLMAEAVSVRRRWRTPSAATSTSSSPGCPGAGRPADSGGVDGLADGVRAPAGVLRPGKEEGEAAPAAGPQAHSAGHRQGHPHHPGDGGGGRGSPQPDDRLRHRPRFRRSSWRRSSCATSTRSLSSSGCRRRRPCRARSTIWRTSWLIPGGSGASSRTSCGR
jgi:hypothetical protein